MSEERRVTISKRFGTVRIRERGPVKVGERFVGPVRFLRKSAVIGERFLGPARFVQKSLKIGERVLTSPVRFIGQQYDSRVISLEITDFEFDTIGRSFALVNYTTNKPTQCTIYTRMEDPLGEWEGKSYTGYHDTHFQHSTVNLLQGTWYHLYVYVIAEDASEDTEPDYPPYVWRFKTASIYDPGEIDEIIWES